MPTPMLPAVTLLLMPSYEPLIRRPWRSIAKYRAESSSKPTAPISAKPFSGTVSTPKYAVVDLQVREPDAALDPQLRREPVLARDHQRALDQRRRVAERVDLEGLDVALELAHQREARPDEATDVTGALAGERAVVAVRALDVATAVRHAAEPEAEAEDEPARCGCGSHRVLRVGGRCSPGRC